MGLAGMNDLRGLLGGADMGYNAMGPTPEDMQREMEAVLYNKKVLLHDFQERTLTLSNAKDRKEYRRLILLLSNGALSKTHLITGFDRRFVERPTPHWIVHMEWVEYELIITPIPTVGSATGKEGRTNAKMGKV
jgi:hypothetical protein